MPSRLSREHLARAGYALNAAARAYPLPPLVLMTDEKRLADPLAAARALPRGSAVILRRTDSEARASLAIALKPIARRCGLSLLIANDAALAARIGADGLHLPEARMREAAHWKALHSFWLVTVAAHSARALMLAANACADAAILASIFETKSHETRRPVGVARARLMAARASLPVYALGGIDASNVGRLSGAKLAGIAAIGGLIPD
jgi:thiamine-phosphate pyrophosphorylase